MYEAIWKRLPGKTWMKIVEAAALFAIAVALLFLFVFPIVNQWVSEANPSTVV